MSNVQVQCERWSLSKLRDVCDELNIRYSRHDSKRILCDKIKMYNSRSEYPFTPQQRAVPQPEPQQPEQQPEESSDLFSPAPRFINPALFEPPEVPTRFINPALFQGLPSQVEEDQQVFTNIQYKSKLKHEQLACANDDLISMEPYKSIEETIQIFTLNNQNEYKTSACISYSELYSLLKSDNDSIINQKDPMPLVIKSIYQVPLDGSCDTSGRGCIATGKIVIKMPPNNIYITHGSFMRILSRPEHEWYALPLYGGKKRRIGNVSEIYASSVDHGQVPGYRVYKLFTKTEIEQGVEVKVTFPDTVEDQINSYEIEYFKQHDFEFFDYTIRERQQNLHLSNFNVKQIISELFDCYLTTLSLRAFE